MVKQIYQLEYHEHCSFIKLDIVFTELQKWNKKKKPKKTHNSQQVKRNKYYFIIGSK